MVIETNTFLPKGMFRGPGLFMDRFPELPGALHAGRSIESVGMHFLRASIISGIAI